MLVDSKSRKIPVDCRYVSSTRQLMMEFHHSGACSFKYTTINEATKQIPQGSSKKCLPIDTCPPDLLEISWRGTVLQDPFGLCSAPIIFSAVADVLAWAILVFPITLMIFSSGLSNLNNATAITVSPRVEPTKVEGQSTSITFLGIEINFLNPVLCTGYVVSTLLFFSLIPLEQTLFTSYGINQSINSCFLCCQF